MIDTEYDNFVSYLKDNQEKIKPFLQKQRKLAGCQYLSKASNRFDKGKFVEIPLCNILSELKYDEQDGFDALFRGLKISIKSEKKFFYVRDRKGDCKEVILKNSNASTSGSLVNIDPPDFDVLLLVSSLQESLAVVKRDNITFITKGSQVKSASLTKDRFTFIIEPNYALKEENNLNLDEQIKTSKEKWVLDIYERLDELIVSGNQLPAAANII